MRLNEKAVEFDFMLPIVADRHAIGEDGAAGWMYLKNTPKLYALFGRLARAEEHVILIGFALAA